MPNTLLLSKIPFSSGFASAPMESQDAIFVPYTAYIRVIPQLGTGKRWTMLRMLEKAAQKTEDALLRNVPPFLISQPVAYTVQMGDNPARLTIVGFNAKSYATGRRVVAPTTNIKEIHSGTDQGQKTALISGNVGGSLSAGQDPITIINTEVKALRDSLFTVLSPVFGGSFTKKDILAIEYNGVKYGVKKQGCRSFPV